MVRLRKTFQHEIKETDSSAWKRRDEYMIKTYRCMQNAKFCRNRGMTTLYKSNKETIRLLTNEKYFFQHVIE